MPMLYALDLNAPQSPLKKPTPWIKSVKQLIFAPVDQMLFASIKIARRTDGIDTKR